MTDLLEGARVRRRLVSDGSRLTAIECTLCGEYFAGSFRTAVDRLTVAVEYARHPCPVKEGSDGSGGHSQLAWVAMLSFYGARSWVESGRHIPPDVSDLIDTLEDLALTEGGVTDWTGGVTLRQDDWVTYPEAERLSGKSHRQLQRWVADNRVESKLESTRVLLKRKDLLDAE